MSLTNTKTSQNDTYFATCLTKTVTGPNCVLLRPTPTTTKPRRFRQTRFYDARFPNSTHTNNLLCRWLRTKLLAQHPQLFLWDMLRHTSSGSVLLQFPETQNVTYSAVSSGLYGFQPLLLLDVIWFSESIDTHPRVLSVLIGQQRLV